mgnify:FL=1
MASKMTFAQFQEKIAQNEDEKVRQEKKKIGEKLQKEVKVGSEVNHPSFGNGIVKKIETDFLIVTFNGSDRTLSIPMAYENELIKLGHDHSLDVQEGQNKGGMKFVKFKYGQVLEVHKHTKNKLDGKDAKDMFNAKVYVPSTGFRRLRFGVDSQGINRDPYNGKDPKGWINVTVSALHPNIVGVSKDGKKFPIKAEEAKKYDILPKQDSEGKYRLALVNKENHVIAPRYMQIESLYFNPKDVEIWKVYFTSIPPKGIGEKRTGWRTPEPALITKDELISMYAEQSVAKSRKEREYSTVKVQKDLPQKIEKETTVENKPKQQEQTTKPKRPRKNVDIEH